MHPDNRAKLQHRVVTAAEASLKARGYVSAIDLLLGIGWLTPAAVEEWRRGQLRYLEAGVQANLARISEAMQLLRGWAVGRRLKPSETAYVGRAPARGPLRFSKSGQGDVERHYRTHWVSPELGEKKRAKVAAGLQPPREPSKEAVVGSKTDPS